MGKVKDEIIMQAGIRLETKDERIFEGAPCTGKVIYVGDNIYVLLRGDEDECKSFRKSEILFVPYSPPGWFEVMLKNKEEE